MKKILLVLLLLFSFSNADELNLTQDEIKFVKKLYTKMMGDGKMSDGGLAISVKKVKTKKDYVADGVKLYTKKCQSCHGAKANKEPYFTARKLITLTKDQFNASIDGYMMRSYDRGQADKMHMIADQLNNDDIDSIYEYIQTLK